MTRQKTVAYIASLVVVFSTLGLTCATAESSSTLRVCELVDLALAVQILGPDAQMAGDDNDAEACMYLVPGKAMLMVQLWTAEGYDQVILGGPHTPVDIGERGRRSTDHAKSVTVQFVKGDYSITMTASNVASATVSYLDPLLAAARVVAQRLP